LAEEIFHMPVRLARPVGVSGLSDEINNPIYSTAVGLLLYAATRENKKTINKYQSDDKKSSFGRIKDWIKDNF
jgi:cell division protein FtsA